MVFLQAAARAAGPAAACLALVDDHDIELLLSAPIVAEIRGVLSRPNLVQKFPVLTAEYIDTFLSALVGKATVVDDVPRSFEFDRDPKDEPYINLAAAGGASYLVSRDNDLLDLMADTSFRTRFPRLTVLDPVAFLQACRERPIVDSESAS
jgi:putative PIN family toxin of toxin-antitoxin system